MLTGKLTGYMLNRNILWELGIPKINLQPGCEFESWGQQNLSFKHCCWSPGVLSLILCPSNSQTRRAQHCMCRVLICYYHVENLQNVGVHFETWNAGVLGPVSLSGLNEGWRDLSWQKWFYKVSFLLVCSPGLLCIS